MTMASQSFPTADEFQDTELGESENQATATIECPETTVDDEAAAPAGEKTSDEAGWNADDYCPHCGSAEPWGCSSWCPQCGFYPMFGKCVETGPHRNAPEELDFFKLVPPWAWILGAGIAAIVVLSFSASMVIKERAGLRLLWALAQCGLGAIAASIAHFSAYLSAIVDSDRFTPFDFIMKPVDIWKTVAKALPKVAWRFWALSWGVTASLCALLVIGGIRYSAIFDWGIEKPAEANLVQAIVDEARQEQDGGAESLEEAMNDFVGDEESAKKGGRRTASRRAAESPETVARREPRPPGRTDLYDKRSFLCAA